MSLPTPEELPVIVSKLRPVLGAMVDHPKFPQLCEAVAIGGDPDPKDFGIVGQTRSWLGMKPKDIWQMGSEHLGTGTPEAVISRLTAGNWFNVTNAKLATL